MTRLAPLTLAAAAALALAGCSKSKPDDEANQAENVEMPAEEAVSDIDATPVADPAANATDAPAPVAAPGASAPAAAPSPAAKN